LDKNKLRPDDPRWSRDLHRQARKFRDEGKWAEAEIEERKLLAIREKWLGKTASDSVFSVAYLAEAIRHQGRAQEAMKMIDERFRLMELQDPEETQIGVVSLLVEKAQCLNSLGRSGDALPLLEQALKLRKEVPRYNKYGPKADEINQVLVETKMKAAVKS
jgi:tetratricopeptide (TPR) repeat protein